MTTLLISFDQEVLNQHLNLVTPEYPFFESPCLLAGEGLHPSAKGKRVAFDGPSRTVIDGPFAETRELVAGFWLWEVKDMAEAVAWVKRCPNPMPGPSEIEIRPVYEMADFGEALTAEVAELHERVRDKAAGR